MPSISERRMNPVYKTINKPLTIWGAERKLFFVAMMMGAATFNFFTSLGAGVLTFAVLWVLARWATATDPQILRLLINASNIRNEYDPAKLKEQEIRVLQHAEDH